MDIVDRNGPDGPEWTRVDNGRGISVIGAV